VKEGESMRSEVSSMRRRREVAVAGEVSEVGAMPLSERT
jgi:hypothetical protein